MPPYDKYADMITGSLQGLGGALPGIQKDMDARAKTQAPAGRQRSDRELAAKYEELIRSGQATPKQAAYLYQQEMTQTGGLGPTPATQPQTPYGGIPGMRQGTGLSGPSPMMQQPTPYSSEGQAGPQRQAFGLSAAPGAGAGERFSSEDITRLKDLGIPNMYRDRQNIEGDIERTRLVQGGQDERARAKNKLLQEMQSEKFEMDREKLEKQSDMLDRKLAAYRTRAERIPGFNQTAEGARLGMLERVARAASANLSRYLSSINSTGPDDEVAKLLQGQFDAAMKEFRGAEKELFQGEKGPAQGAPPPRLPASTEVQEPESGWNEDLDARLQELEQRRADLRNKRQPRGGAAPGRPGTRSAPPRGPDAFSRTVPMTYSVGPARETSRTDEAGRRNLGTLKTVKTKR